MRSREPPPPEEAPPPPPSVSARAGRGEARTAPTMVSGSPGPLWAQRGASGPGRSSAACSWRAGCPGAAERAGVGCSAGGHDVPAPGAARPPAGHGRAGVRGRGAGGRGCSGQGPKRGAPGSRPGLRPAGPRQAPTAGGARWHLV